MSGVRIGAADAADAPALARLESAAMGPEAWGVATLQEELAAEGRVVLLARDVRSDALVGWVDLAVAGDVADLLRVAVAPDARRQGVAAALLGAAYAALPADVDRVLLEVAAGNERARALYADQGFAEIARRPGYYRDGGDAVVLQRHLRARSGTPTRTTTPIGGRP